MYNNFLSSSFNLKGNNRKELLNDLQVFAKGTFTRAIEPYDLVLYSIVSVKNDGFIVIELNPDEMDIHSIAPRNNESILKNGYNFVPFKDFIRLGIDMDLIEDIRNEGFFLKYRGKVILPAEGCANLISKACKFGRVPTEPSPVRDMYLAYLLGEADPFKIMLRSNGHISKLIDIVSEKHKHIDQSNMTLKALDLISDECPEAQVTFYSLDHKKSVVKLEFTDLKVSKKSKRRYVFTPATIITISDDTDTKSSVQGCIGMEGRFIKLDNSISLCLPEKEIRARLRRMSEEMIAICDHIASLDADTLRDRRESIIELANAADLPSVGQKVFRMYEDYINAIDDISEADVFAELMSFPSRLSYIAGKEVPQYVTDKAERLVGQMLQKYA